MSVTSGTYELGPHRGRLIVRTSRTGLGSKAGHDLTIEVTRWRGSASIDGAVPGRSTVQVEADVASMEVREGTGGIKPLTNGDRAEIHRTMREKILTADRHPTITFASTQVIGDADSFRIEGDLTVAGATNRATVHGRIVDGRAQGSVTITQSAWGIKPYSAFFGALKLSDDVQVEFDVELVP